MAGLLNGASIKAAGDAGPQPGAALPTQFSAGWHRGAVNNLNGDPQGIFTLPLASCKLHFTHRGWSRDRWPRRGHAAGDAQPGMERGPCEAQPGARFPGHHPGIGRPEATARQRESPRRFYGCCGNRWLFGCRGLMATPASKRKPAPGEARRHPLGDGLPESHVTFGVKLSVGWHRAGQKRRLTRRRARCCGVSTSSDLSPFPSQRFLLDGVHRLHKNPEAKRGEGDT